MSKKKKIKKLEKALDILMMNSYCHNTPYMVCIPNNKWSKAMKTVQEAYQ